MPNGIQPFKEFVDSINDIKLENARTLPRSLVADEDSLKEMKQHLISLYDGVDCEHSFLDEAGQVFDCIPIEHQPSLRGKDVVIPKMPEIPEFLETMPTKADECSSFGLSSERQDALGNTMWCEPGMIPMRRVTLEEMARFGSLNNFLQKSPRGGKSFKSKLNADANDAHRYAHGWQSVDNRGGASNLSVWQPYVNQDLDQDFSLSQIWVMGGGDANDILQTVESGWQVFPVHYNNTQSPILFIYWTPNNYASGGPGCYNLEGPGFVQFNNGIALGSVVPANISVPGGAQGFMGVGYYMNYGFGWYHILWIPDAKVVGYYPMEIFNGGKLTQNADTVDFGGETACSPDAVIVPPMGSGVIASAGATFAATHSNMNYVAMSGSSISVGQLDVGQTPPIYTFQQTNGSNTMYFGGPGGDIGGSE